MRYKNINNIYIYIYICLIIDLTPFVLVFNMILFFTNCSSPVFPYLIKIIKALAGPKYDGKYLHNLVKEKLGHTKLEKTLTNVVIPSFDIKTLQPTIFSSYEVCHFLSLKWFFNPSTFFSFNFHNIFSGSD